MKRTTLTLLILSAAYLQLGTASAQVTGNTSASGSGTQSSSAQAPVKGQESQRLVNEFADFSGSQENAASLVTGLRSGSAVTLVGTGSTTGSTTGGTTGSGSTTGSATGSASGATSSETSFISPTGPMGWGEVRHALTYARESLADQGITNPTPEQLKATLIGGAMTSADGAATTSAGVLQMRSEGMGWGQIAHTLDISPSGRATPVPSLGASGAIVNAVGGRVVGGGREARASHSASAGADAETGGNVGGNVGSRSIGAAMGAASAIHGGGALSGGEGLGIGIGGGARGGGGLGLGLGRHR